MDKRVIKRRDFLKVSAAAVLGTAATACAAKEKIVTQIVTQEVEKIVQQTVEVEKEVEKVVEATKIVEVEKQVEKEVQVTVEVPKGVAEPPFLQAKVAAGELPPLEERLPQNPVVVGGRDAVGVYGGEIRMQHFDPVWFTSNYDLNSERCLHYSDLDMRTIVGNIFEGWEVTPDGKEWTFMMRKGMKWSDGEPLTSEDARLFCEDFWLNIDVLGYAAPWQFRVGGPNMTFEVIDDFTFKVTFAVPFGNLAAHTTRMEPNNWASFITPAHYMKQFLPQYNDQATLEAKAKDLGYDTVALMISNRLGQWGCGSWRGDDWIVKDNYPVLGPWMIVERPSEGLYLWERNPYYWKVDLAGNQLPYIDTMQFTYSSTIENTQLMIFQGQLDIVGMHDVTVADYPLYKEKEPDGNFSVGDLISCMSDRYVLFPQHYLVDDAGNPDEVMNTIINHPNFVKALSVAIDRSEVNESLFYGLARVGQIAPMPSSKYYKPKYGEAYATYNPDQANQLLDEMGLTKDSGGMRLRPDGKVLTLMIEHAGSRVGPATAKYCEMVCTYWREIGIDATAKEVQETLYNQRMNAFQTQVGVWHADRCTDLLLHIQPQWYIPTADAGQGTCCAAWSNWFNAADRTAADLIQPPDEVKALYGYFDQMTSVVSEDERVQWGQKLFDWLADNPLEIGLILECPAPLLFNKNLRNLPRPKSVIGWDTYGQSTYHPEAYFYEGGKRF